MTIKMNYELKPIKEMIQEVYFVLSLILGFLIGFVAMR